MALFEHLEYHPTMKKLAEDENIVVAKGKPQHLKVGEPVGDGKVIKDIYTVAIVGPAEEGAA